MRGCDHEWDQRGDRVFTPPAVTENVKGPIEATERLLFGFTSVELRCVKCGDLKVHRFVGDLRGTAA